MYKVEIWENYNYGGWTLSFMKEIELPFAPFHGLVINEQEDHDIEFATHEYCTTRIDWSLENQKFSVDVRHVWKRPVTNETVDDIIEIHNSWTRTDNTDVDELKKLMFNYRGSSGLLR